MIKKTSSVYIDPRIIIKLQISLGISLFSKLEHYKYIIFIRILLWCAFFFLYIITVSPIEKYLYF